MVRKGLLMPHSCIAAQITHLMPLHSTQGPDHFQSCFVLARCFILHMLGLEQELSNSKRLLFPYGWRLWMRISRLRGEMWRICSYRYYWFLSNNPPNLFCFNTITLSLLQGIFTFLLSVPWV